MSDSKPELEVVMVKPSPTPEHHYLTAITPTTRGSGYLLACVCGWLAMAPTLHVGGYWENHRKGRAIEHE